MDIAIQPPKKFGGSLTLPPDKAICHRAALLSALASGPTRLSPWPSADDCQRTLGIIRALGVRVLLDGDAAIVEGAGLSGMRASKEPLDCGESGTTFRLSAGILAGQPFDSVLTASPSLLRRPMRRITDPLTLMGCRISGKANPANSGEVFPPLSIQGRKPLKGIEYALPVASAQVKSAVLLAGLFADGPTTVIERHATRDHTERAFKAFGLSVNQKGGAVTVVPGSLRSPSALVIPGDISSAAFFMAAAACVPGASVEITGVGLNPTRSAVIDVLRRMGADIEIQQEANAWEPRGAVRVKSSALTSINLAPDEVPGVIDELPILMVAAACAKGTSRFSGVGELRVKETDRIQSMVNGLSRMGAKIRLVEPDTVEIVGGSKLVGAAVDSAGDHRTAMSLAIAGLAASGSTRIQRAECVAKSLPGFFDLLGQLADASTVKRIDKP